MQTKHHPIEAKLVAPSLIMLLLFPFVCDASDRPNIVVILVDDLRYDTFGFMGHPFVETSAIDQMAQDGTHFRNAFVTTSLCSPARASLLTGKYMHNHRVVDNNDRMPTGTRIFPERLQSIGYQTAFIGKWHMGGSSDHPRPGFDHWVSFAGQGTYSPTDAKLNVNGTRVPRQKYMTDELTDYAVNWLNERPRERPFLLYLAHKGVHGLYDPAPRHRDRYKDAEIQLPQSMQAIRDKPMWVQDQRNSWHGVENAYQGRAGQTIAEMYQHYCEMILSIDDSVGRIRQALAENGLNQNTIVFFTSDGGHLWGEHGLIDKRCAYEPSIRIPLLAVGPQVKRNATCDAFVANIDLAPTILERTATDLPFDSDGASFVRLLSDPSAAHAIREQLLYEYYWESNFPQTPTCFAIRTKRYKFIQYHGIWDTNEFYDLVNDPEENTNLIHATEHQQRISRLQSQLFEMLRKTNGDSIALGRWRQGRTHLRSGGGSPRAEFPPHLIQAEDDSK